jgi:hypothetical protein
MLQEYLEAERAASERLKAIEARRLNEILPSGRFIGGASRGRSGGGGDAAF